MTHDDGEIASLRLALAGAERARDEAMLAADRVRRLRQDERREEQRRLRNLFSVIRAVARRTGDDVDSVEDYCGVLDGRLSAYLNIQALVMQDWEKGADLALLLASALQAFALKEGERVDLDGPAVGLTSQAAGILALAFHEFALAAVMSDALDGPGSSLRVSWCLTPAGTTNDLSIEWVETAPTGDRIEQRPSSWAEWVEQAIEYQLAGTVRVEEGKLERSIHLRLPGAVMC